MIKTLGTGLRFVSNAEIKPALGESVEAANGNRAPLRRSDLTFTLMTAQLDGLSDFVVATDWRESLAGEVQPIADSVAFDLDRAIETIASIDRPAEEAFEDEEDWEKLRYVTVALDYAGRMVSERLAGALGLIMGFNALDGD